MKFSSYNLKKELISVINELGYYDLTRIQEASLAKILSGKSLVCKSETGSGKTHAFLIPLINNINLDSNQTQVVIISPTTILATQTYQFAKLICDKYYQISCQLFTSSKEKNKNVSSLEYGKQVPKIIIGTPGRLVDVLIKENKFKGSISTLVLDEADMLLDETNVNDILQLKEFLNPKQRLIFTATMKNHLISDTAKFIGAEEIIDVDNKVKVNRNVSHHLVNIKHQDLIDQLANFINIVNPYFTLIFASMKTQVVKIYQELNKKGIVCTMLSGNIESRENKINLKRIRQGDFKIVVCSDLVSRGLDLEDVTCIINVDLPKDLDYYLHRAGRSGRLNKKGDSYIFYNDDKLDDINRLKKLNLNFDYYVLRKDNLKKVDTITGKTKKVNEQLEKEVRKEISKVRTTKVKPGYKKKIKKAVEKAKKNHKEKIIKKNIREKKKSNKSF